ncbi:MAG: DegT/DnrJ/EryC1/StrS aminotransferase family protein [Pseudomonadota bacterium]
MSVAERHESATAPQPIALFDLKRQQARLRHDIDRRIANVLDHGQYVLGPEVTDLEERLATFSGVKHAVGVSSGRDALIMALMAMGIGRGDAVLVPAFTFSATAAVVIAVGAVPVFVDVKADDYNMDPAAIPAAVEAAKRRGLLPRAVMPVDLFGRPADYRAIAEVAGGFGIKVVADAAQSFGGETADGKVGALAPISCISFYPTKPLGAFGDGGAILTDDDALADAVRQIRTHGRQGDGDEAMRIGMTGRLDTIQAAVLLSKLTVFKAELNRRAEIAAMYTERLVGRLAVPPSDGDGVRSAWALYTVALDGRDRMRAALGEKKIGTGLFYRVPLHRHPAFLDQLVGGESFPVSEDLSQRVLSLPMGPDMGDDEVDIVADALLAAL